MKNSAEGVRQHEECVLVGSCSLRVLRTGRALRL